MKICLFNPGIKNNHKEPSINLGDLIIYQAVERELKMIFEDSKILTVSTHIPLKQEEIKIIQSCDLHIVGGTNLLSSNMNEYNQWKILMPDALQINRAILLGVGWWQYQDPANDYTKALLKLALSEQFFHSVRDKYTQEKLQELGINNVINTGCPTMWDFVNFNCEDIPKQKSQNVLLMLTDYKQNRELDQKLIDILHSEYEKVFFFPQGSLDEEYIRSLDFSGIYLEHSLDSLKSFLKSGINFDYIGTRLHGGIYCLLNQKRSLIIEVDNRAKEIALDTKLPTIQRDDFKGLQHWISKESITDIKVDSTPINQWREQFKKLNIREDYSNNSKVYMNISKLDDNQDFQSSINLNHETIKKIEHSFKVVEELRLELQKKLMKAYNDYNIIQTNYRNTQSQLQDTQSQLQDTQSQLQDTQSQLQDTQSHLQDTQNQLQNSQERVLAMKSSKFWKLRKVWFKLKQRLGFKDK